MSRYCMIPAILYSGEGKTMEIIIIKKKLVVASGWGETEMKKKSAENF